MSNDSANPDKKSDASEEAASPAGAPEAAKRVDSAGADSDWSEDISDSVFLVDDHEEEVAVGGRIERRKGIYLLPNLFTTAALFSGFYAVISAMNKNFEAAAIAIFAAMVFDGLDGRVARLTNTQSKFGAEYDSLADVVSFGVAPALVMFSYSLQSLGKFGWTCAFIYVACAALRLARFNTQIDVTDKNIFVGLASPAAAALIAGSVWVCFDAGWDGSSSFIAYMLAFLTAASGILMIANVPYQSFKGIDLKGRVPFVVLLIVVLIFGLVTLDPPKILLAASFLYAISGPVERVVRSSDA